MQSRSLTRTHAGRSDPDMDECGNRAIALGIHRTCKDVLNMRKILKLVLALCLTFTAMPTLAAQPPDFVTTYSLDRRWAVHWRCL